MPGITDAPEPLRDITAAFEQARTILQLCDDWDGEGGKPISEQTWRRAAEFLTRQAHWLWEVSRRVLPPPDITPVPDGSIDLHWDRQRFELLINIPLDPTAPAEFYGDDRGGITTRGQLDTLRDNEGPVLWMISR